MVLSEAVVEAARAGNVATVEQWLNAGGDANERCATTGKTLLHCIASDSLRSDEVERGRCDIARLLLARGAEVDAIRIQMPGMALAPSRNTPLLSASLYHRKELCELLCEAGADPNYQRFSEIYPHEPPDFPLWMALSDPETIRVLLRFGADPSQKGGCHGDLRTPEEEAARRIHPGFASADWLRESFRLLRDARLLRPRLRGVFVLRALVLRGRAAQKSATPGKFAAPGDFFAQRRLRAAAKLLASPGLPDPLAHLVCKFWLGDPPRRAKRTA